MPAEAEQKDWEDRYTDGGQRQDKEWPASPVRSSRNTKGRKSRKSVFVASGNEDSLRKNDDMLARQRSHPSRGKDEQEGEHSPDSGAAASP